MKITAKDLLDYGIIDRIIKEPLGGAHKDKENIIKNLKENLSEAITRLKSEPIEGILTKRYYKFRKIGQYTE